MQARRLVKRSVIGSRVNAPGCAAAAGEAAVGERENGDSSKEPVDEETTKGQRKQSLKVS